MRKPLGLATSEQDCSSGMSCARWAAVSSLTLCPRAVSFTTTTNPLFHCVDVLKNIRYVINVQNRNLNKRKHLNVYFIKCSVHQSERRRSKTASKISNLVIKWKMGVFSCRVLNNLHLDSLNPCCACLGNNGAQKKVCPVAELEIFLREDDTNWWGVLFQGPSRTALHTATWAPCFSHRVRHLASVQSLMTAAQAHYLTGRM